MSTHELARFLETLGVVAFFTLLLLKAAGVGRRKR